MNALQIFLVVFILFLVLRGSVLLIAIFFNKKPIKRDTFTEKNNLPNPQEQLYLKNKEAIDNGEAYIFQEPSRFWLLTSEFRTSIILIVLPFSFFLLTSLLLEPCKNTFGINHNLLLSMNAFAPAIPMLCLGAFVDFIYGFKYFISNKRSETYSSLLRIDGRYYLAEKLTNKNSWKMWVSILFLFALFLATAAFLALYFPEKVNERLIEYNQTVQC